MSNGHLVFRGIVSNEQTKFDPSIIREAASSSFILENGQTIFNSYNPSGNNVLIREFAFDVAPHDNTLSSKFEVDDVNDQVIEVFRTQIAMQFGILKEIRNFSFDGLNKSKQQALYLRSSWQTIQYGWGPKT